MLQFSYYNAGYMLNRPFVPTERTHRTADVSAAWDVVTVYDSDTVYIVGDAKAPENNPITKQYQAFFITFVIHRETGEIVDAECAATVSLTKRFVSGLLIGKNILNLDALTSEVKDRYFGSSQKAVLVAIKDAQKKYKRLIHKKTALR